MKKPNRHLRLLFFVLALSLCAMLSDRMGNPVPDLVENVLAESLVVLMFSYGSYSLFPPPSPPPRDKQIDLLKT
ncbi:hypothetical protein BH23CYA1_BH23CYA1_00900 [soil metagenome]